MTKLVLVRHGQTDWNLNRRIQGSTDIPLNDAGRQEAMEAAIMLQEQTWHAVVTSPLSRARETACIIAAELNLNAPRTLDTIVERNYGAGEGLTGEELLTQFPDGVDVPGRESREQVAERVVPALTGLAAQYPGQSVIVVTHGGVIGTMLRYVSDGALPAPGELIANGSAHEFRYNDGALRVVRGGKSHGPRDVVSAAVS